MLRCTYDPCDEEAEYICFGRSFCKFHFKKEVKEVVELKRRAKEAKKRAKEKGKT